MHTLTILCPIDYSDCSKRTLRFGGALAEHFSLRLVVLHVFDRLVAAADFARASRPICSAGSPSTSCTSTDTSVSTVVMSLGSSAMPAGHRKPGSVAYRVLCLAPAPVLPLPGTSSGRASVQCLDPAAAISAPAPHGR